MKKSGGDWPGGPGAAIESIGNGRERRSPVPTPGTIALFLAALLLLAPLPGQKQQMPNRREER